MTAGPDFGRCLLLAVAVAAMRAESALAQDSALFGPTEIGNWTVYSYSGSSCSMDTVYDDGTIMTFSHDVRDEDVTLTFSNARWVSLTDRERYQVRLNFDGEYDYRFTGVGAASDGSLDPRVYVFLRDENDEFKADFALSLGMRVWLNNNYIGNLSLDRTYDAILEVARCVGQLRHRPVTDPFAG